MNLSRRIGRLANLLNLPFLTSREYNLYFRKKKGVFDIFFIFIFHTRWYFLYIFAADSQGEENRKHIHFRN